MIKRHVHHWRTALHYDVVFCSGCSARFTGQQLHIVKRDDDVCRFEPRFQYVADAAWAAVRWVSLNDL